jgi:hypothetical protein
MVNIMRLIIFFTLFLMACGARPARNNADTWAITWTKEHVKKKMQFPEEADFGNRKAEDLGGGVYRVTGECTGKTALGLKKILKFDYIMEHDTLKDPSEPGAWKVLTQDVRE